MKERSPYTVVVVEDEEQASEHICKIIERRLPDFCVVGKAENGMDALTVIGKAKPDVVVTDIHMPLMNGVTLLSRIAKEYPDVLSIVVSGYQDFDSVKGALTNGSLDYILKPLSPAKIEKAFGTLREKLLLSGEEKRGQLLVRLSKNLPVSRDDERKYFGEGPYFLAVRRFGSLPSRFVRSLSVSRASRAGRLLTLSGRDDCESVYLISADDVPYGQFRYLLNDRLRTESAAENIFSTVVLRKEPFPVGQFFSALTELMEFLDSAVTIGYTQEREFPSDRPAEFSFSSIRGLLERAELYLRENRFRDFQKELAHSIDEWGKAKRPQIWIEDAVRMIFCSTVRGSRNADFDFNYNFMLDTIFRGTETVDAVKGKILGVFSHVFQMEYGTFEKFDCPSFFGQVSAYLASHCSEKISMSDLCAVFGISQTYMNMLFKKYASVTFNKYLLNLRMHKAVDLLETNENLQVKDLAVLAGFSDPLYFSKLFHKEFGRTPSEYGREKRRERQDRP